MLVLALIGVVLLQRSEGGGLGIGGGGGGFMTSRGTANVLTRATAILAGLFFATSLLLSILAGFNRKPTSIIRGGQSGPPAPAVRRRRRRRRAAACSNSCSRARRARSRRPPRRRTIGAAGAAVEVNVNEGPGNRPFGV